MLTHSPNHLPFTLTHSETQSLGFMETLLPQCTFFVEKYTNPQLYRGPGISLFSVGPINFYITHIFAISQHSAISLIAFEKMRKKVMFWKKIQFHFTA